MIMNDANCESGNEIRPLVDTKKIDDEIISEIMKSSKAIKYEKKIRLQMD